MEAELFMIKTKFEKEYCMTCGRENPQDREICECGGRNFVFGDNFHYHKKKGVTCGCGNNQFQMISHVNMNPIYNKTYRCVQCDNVIGVQTYYKSPYL